jgi:hypothetical protein
VDALEGGGRGKEEYHIDEKGGPPLRRVEWTLGGGQGWVWGGKGYRREAAGAEDKVGQGGGQTLLSPTPHPHSPPT